MTDSNDIHSLQLAELEHDTSWALTTTELGGFNYTYNTGAQGPEEETHASPARPPFIVVGDYVLDAQSQNGSDASSSGSPFRALVRQTTTYRIPSSPSAAELERRRDIKWVDAMDARGRRTSVLAEDLLLEETMSLRGSWSYEVKQELPARPPRTRFASLVTRERDGEVRVGLQGRVRLASKTRSPLDTVASIGWRGLATLALTVVTPIVAPYLMAKQLVEKTGDVVCDLVDGHGSSDAVREVRNNNRAAKGVALRNIKTKAKRRAIQARLAQWRKRYEDEHGTRPCTFTGPMGQEIEVEGMAWTVEREIAVVADVVTTIGTLLPYCDKYVVEAQRRLRDFYRSHDFWKTAPEDVRHKLVNRGVNFLRPVWLDTVAMQQDALNHQTVFDYTEMWRERREGRIVLKHWFSAWWAGEASLLDFMPSRRTGYLATE